MLRITFAAVAALVLVVPASARDVSMAGVVPELVSKIQQIKAACLGVSVISAVRHTRIRGSGRMSLHASGRAVDVAGNPTCVYRELQGWPGGYSTDYSRVRHIHISIGGFENGLRFAHYGKRKAKRLARKAPRGTIADYATAWPQQ